MALIVALLFSLAPAATAAEAPGVEPPAGHSQEGVGQPVPGRLLVTVDDAEALADLPRDLNVESNPALDRLGVRVVDVPPGQERRFQRLLEEVPGVGQVEPDVLVHAASVVPNDPEWSQQWALRRTNAHLAWTIATGSAETVVAVLDTGVDGGHRDLRGAVLPGFNALTDGSNVSDRNGHGTSVAGIIAARTNNGVGVASYCWRCSILPVKVLNDRGEGSTAHVAAGIVWAADHGADVINLSLGGPSTTNALRSAVRYAHDRGVLITAAAGNEGSTTRFYPAAHDEVIGVAATDPNDRRYAWSNHGSWVLVAAPGCSRSTVPGGGYATSCGTSSASPVVAGVLALSISRRPDASATDQRNWLAQGAVNVGSFVARGRVDGYLTLDAAARDTSSDPTPPTWPSGSRVTANPSSFTSIDLSWSHATDDVGVTGYRALVDGRVVALSSGRSTRVNDLHHSTTYGLAIQARDAAGNWSTQLRTTASTFVRFRDVASGSTFESDIGWLAAEGITRGCNPPANDRYCPTDQVSRAQMAAFIVRALDLTRTSGIRFRDVPRGSTFERDIDRLATAGITRGCNPPSNDRYCPTDPVSRAQMAAFMSRAMNLRATSGVRFRDVPRGSTFETDIDRLATAGITRGCNPPSNDRYCPTDPVSRAQMAAFVRRAEP